MNDAQIYLLKLFLISLFSITGTFAAIIIIFYFTTEYSADTTQFVISPVNNTE